MKVQDNSKGWPEGWLVAAAAAVLAAAMGRLVGDLGLFATVVVAIFVFLVFGVLLGMFWGGPVAQPHHSGLHAPAHGGTAHHHDPQGPASKTQPPAHPAAHKTAPATVSAAPATHVDPVPASSPVTVATAPAAPVSDKVPLSGAASRTESDPAVMLQTDLTGGPQVTLEAVENPGTPAAADGPVPMAQTADALAEPAPEPEAPPPVPEQTAFVDPATPGGVRPQGLSAARNGVADQLQVIEGIGPAMEKLCHDLGFYHFDQIAGWGPAEVAWMDANLKGFKGRVSRDRWVRQAALICEVGVDEFLRRAKSNEY